VNYDDYDEDPEENPWSEVSAEDGFGIIITVVHPSSGGSLTDTMTSPI
jgi:hypothetical protein